MDAVNNLVEKDELVAWSRMKEERRERTITKLLHTVEQSALTLAKNCRGPTELEIKASDMGRTTCCHGSSFPENRSSFFHVEDKREEIAVAVLDLTICRTVKLTVNLFVFFL